MALGRNISILFESVEGLVLGNDDALLNDAEFFSSSLQELTAVGTHLIKWEGERNYKSRGEGVILISFLRRIIEIIDAISILIKARTVEPCRVLIRVLLESILQLKYLLDSNTEVKSYTYAYVLHKNDYLSLLKKHPSASTYKDLKDNFEHNSLIFKSVPIVSDLEQKIKDLEQIFLNPLFKEVHSGFQRSIEDEYIFRTKGKKKEIPWYVMFSGYQNFFDLAKGLRMFDLYEVLYRPFSKSTHSANTIEGNFQYFDDKYHIVEIRNTDEMAFIALLAVELTQIIYRSIMLNQTHKNVNEFIWAMSAFDKHYKSLIVRKLSDGR